MTSNAMTGPAQKRDDHAETRRQEARAIVVEANERSKGMLTLAELHGPRRTRIIVCLPGSMMDFSGGDVRARIREIANPGDLPTTTE